MTALHTPPDALQAASAGPAQLSPAKAARELRKLTSALPKRDLQLKLNTVSAFILAPLCPSLLNADHGKEVCFPGARKAGEGLD